MEIQDFFNKHYPFVFSIEHLQPKAPGGDLSISNTVWAHHRCNMARCVMDASKFDSLVKVLKANGLDALEPFLQTLFELRLKQLAAEGERAKRRKEAPLDGGRG